MSNQWQLIPSITQTLMCRPLHEGCSDVEQSVVGNFRVVAHDLWEHFNCFCPLRDVPQKLGIFPCTSFKLDHEANFQHSFASFLRFAVIYPLRDGRKRRAKIASWTSYFPVVLHRDLCSVEGLMQQHVVVVDMAYLS